MTFCVLFFVVVENVEDAFPNLCWRLGSSSCSNTDELLYFCLNTIVYIGDSLVS